MATGTNTGIDAEKWKGITFPMGGGRLKAARGGMRGWKQAVTQYGPKWVEGNREAIVKLLAVSDGADAKTLVSRLQRNFQKYVAGELGQGEAQH